MEKRTIILIIFILTTFIPSVIYGAPPVGCSPPSPCGRLSVDSNGNMGFNTYGVVPGGTHATPPQGTFGKVFMLAATSTPPGIGLRNLASGSGGEGNPSLNPATYLLRMTPWGGFVVFDASDGVLFDRHRLVFHGDGKVSIATSSPVAYQFTVAGNAGADEFFGRHAARYIASGAFGNDVGGGNFAFPAALGIGTTSTGGLPANGLYVSGYTGIGTTSPHSNLEVAGVDPQLVLNRSGAWGTRAAGIKFATDAGVTDYWTFGMQPDSTNNMRLRYNASEFLTVLTSGNVGIGTTNPGAKFVVEGAGTGSGLQDGLVLIRATTAANPSAIGFINSGNVSSYNDLAWIRGIITSGSAKGSLSFVTRNSDGNNTGVAERMRIQHDGNVGIGTTAPAQKFEVSDTVNTGVISAVRNLSTGSSAWSEFRLGNDGASNKLVMFCNSTTRAADGGAGNCTIRTDTGLLYLSAGGGQKVTVDTSGNVGIGTIAPHSRLEINKTDSPALYITSNSFGGSLEFGRIVFGSTAGSDAYLNQGAAIVGVSESGINYGALRFLTGDNQSALERVRITSSGNVGIATTTPAQALTVSGNIHATGNITAGGSLSANVNASQVASGVFGSVAGKGNYTFQAAGNSNPVLYVDAGNERVGVGTVSPTEKLEVNGSAKISGVTITGAYSGTIKTDYAYAAGEIYLKPGGTNIAAVFSPNGGVTIGTGGLSGAPPANGLIVPGNVGIGNTAPSTNLVIGNNSGFVNLFGLTAYNSSQPSYALLGQTTNRDLQISWQYNATPANAYGSILTGSYQNPIRIDASVLALQSQSGGNVGIGTTAPGKKLDVDGDLMVRSSGSVFTNWVRDTTGVKYISLDGTGIKLEPAGYGSTVLQAVSTGVNITGNLGVGTASPGAKLHVAGTSYLNGTVYTDSIAHYNGGATPLNFGSAAELSIRADTHNVGIGTTGPGAKLHVRGTDGSGGGGGDIWGNAENSYIGIDASTNSRLGFVKKWGNYPVIAAGSTSPILFGHWSTADLLSNIASGSFTEDIRIGTTGNVGIGTTGPERKLDINGTGGMRSNSTNPGSGTADWIAGNFGGTAGDRVVMGILYGKATIGAHNNALGAWSNLILQTDGGNVGIATTTPAQRLTVDGGIYATGDITAGGTITGAVPAARVSSGAFGSLSSKGNYSFQASSTSDSVLYVDATNARVGIGTVSPLTLLDVRKDSASVVASISMTNGQNSGSAGSYMRWVGSNGAGGLIETGKIDVGTITPGSNSYMSFSTGGAGATEKVRIDNSGNVGIGTTGPSSKLHISSGDVRLQAASQTPGDFSETRGILFTQETDYVVAKIMYSRSAWAYAPSDLSFWTVPAQTGSPLTERMRITSTGNIGIGTTSPGTLLEIQKSGSPDIPNDPQGIRIARYAPGNYPSTYPFLDFYSATSHFTGRISSTFIGGGAWTNAGLQFWTPNSSGVMTVSATINNNGSVGIGTAPTQRLQIDTGVNGVNQGIPATSGTTQKGILRLTPGSTNYGETLDFGMNVGPTYAWIQATNYTGLNTNYSLALNPNGGNIGIGTTNPQAKLQIVNGNADGLLMTYDSSNQYRNSLGNLYEAGNSAGNKMYLKVSDGTVTGQTTVLTAVGNGNVGIGTTVPGAKLEVKADNPEIKLGVNNGALGRISTITFEGTFGTGDNFTNYKMAQIYGGATAQDWTKTYLSLGTWNAASGWVYKEGIRITNDGGVGINTTNPGYLLDVNGYARFNQPVLVGTPTASGHAVTKSYMDSAIGAGTPTAYATSSYACNADATCEMLGANLNSGNITGVNKLTVTTIDPVYEISGVKYATYVSDTIGLKIEYSGKAQLVQNTKYKIQNTQYEYVIDFNKVGSGSDLWLFWQTIDEGKNMADIILNLTPEGEQTSLWYKLVPQQKQIIVYGDKPVKFSYRLEAPRHDAKKWPTILSNSEEPGTILKLK